MEYSLEEWVEQATTDRVTFRQAVHTILLAISSNDYLQPKMVMKGGMLLGIRYKSSRFTEDIDFSTSEKLADVDPVEFESELNESLHVASTELPYRVSCKVQSLKVQPKRGSETATFPSFNLKIGYASLDNPGAMKRLEANSSPNTVKIDYSFNETTYKLDELNLENDDSVATYGFADLIAEKYRSIIQQKFRNRNRRQDVYDLHYLLTNTEVISSEEKMDILNILLKKSEGRLETESVVKLSLDDEETKVRSSENYHLLEKEVSGDLPEFNDAYTLVNSFYKDLPWECIQE